MLVSGRVICFYCFFFTQIFLVEKDLIVIVYVQRARYTVAFFAYQKPFQFMGEITQPICKVGRFTSYK